jgi:hypothetical protein
MQWWKMGETLKVNKQWWTLQEHIMKTLEIRWQVVKLSKLRNTL